jgi:2-polyprenyl-3-methyl-5-hydroxy-6-metoxy-1,4-benzoquinol methylase
VSHSLSEVRAAWDAEAPTYDQDADHGLRDRDVRSAWRSLLLAHLPPAPARVADLGCGTGTLSVLLAAEGYDVSGVDLSEDMLAHARRKATAAEVAVSFTPGDASDPRLEAGEFDVVLCRHVLWALPDPSAALARWVDLLRPGGRLVLVEGSWATGAGLDARRTVGLVREHRAEATVVHLTEPAYWGRQIDDERYLVVSPR